MIELASAGVQVLDCEHKTPRDAGTGYAYIAIPNLVDGRVELSSVRRISAEDLVAWTRRTTPEAGDVVVTRRGRVGDTAVIPEGVQCAIGQNLVLLRSDGEQVDQSYLRWAARGPMWLAEVDRLRNVGAVFDSLNVRDIARLRIPVPPVAEQLAVASVLRSIENKIDSNRQLAALLKETGETLFKARFVDFVDVGSTYCSKGLGGMLLVQGMGGFGDRFPASTVYTTVPTKIAPVGATLMTVRAPVGAVNIANTEVCLGRGVASMTSTTPAFTEFLVRSLRDRWASEESGTIFPAVNGKQIRSLPVVIPPLDEIEAFESTASPLVRQIAGLHAETFSLTAIRDALLPKLISGEIRIPDTADADEILDVAAQAA